MEAQQSDLTHPTPSPVNPKVFWSLIAILATLQGWFWLRAGHI